MDFLFRERYFVLFLGNVCVIHYIHHLYSRIYSLDCSLHICSDKTVRFWAPTTFRVPKNYLKLLFIGFSTKPWNVTFKYWNTLASVLSAINQRVFLTKLKNCVIWHLCTNFQFMFYLCTRTWLDLILIRAWFGKVLFVSNWSFII